MRELLGGLYNFTENKMSPVEPRTTLLYSQRTLDKSLLLSSVRGLRVTDVEMMEMKSTVLLVSVRISNTSKQNSCHTLSASYQSRGSQT